MVGKKSEKHNADKPQADGGVGKPRPLVAAESAQQVGNQSRVRLDARHYSGWFRPHSLGDRSLRIISIAYFLLLTALLLTRDPFRMMGISPNVRGILGPLQPYAHFLSFLLLTVLALSVRWPLRRWILLLTLVAYAVATECVQWFVAGRCTELRDLVQNILGVAAGVGVYWICIRTRLQIMRYAGS